MCLGYEGEQLGPGSTAPMLPVVMGLASIWGSLVSSVIHTMSWTFLESHTERKGELETERLRKRKIPVQARLQASTTYHLCPKNLSILGS